VGGRADRDEARAPRRNARGEARRKAVIDAALRVVGEKGLSGVTHRAVATEANITPGLTTYYFPTVDDLLEATLSSFVDEELVRLHTAMQTLADTEGEIDREAVLGAVFAAVAVEPAQQVAQFELYLEAVRRPGLRSVARDCLNGYADLARLALERVGSDRAEEGARAFVALIDGFALQQLVHPDETFVARVALPAVLALLGAYAPAEPARS
jgi:DNA-binding transcriptional regulator YbjK